MQSDQNSFCNYIVLECVNMEFGDEDNILDQIYEKHIYSDLYYEDGLKKLLKKMHIWSITALNKINFVYIFVYFKKIQIMKIKVICFSYIFKIATLSLNAMLTLSKTTSKPSDRTNLKIETFAVATTHKPLLLANFLKNKIIFTRN